MGQAVGMSCSLKTNSGRLVWDTAQVMVKVILKHVNISMISIPENCWEQVEELASFDS